MPLPTRVSVRTLAPIFAQAARGGVDAGTLAAAVGHELDLVRDADAQLAYDTVTALWNEAARRTGDPAFGVHAAIDAPPGIYDVMEYAALASRTLGDALRRLCDYQRLVTEVASFSFERDTLVLQQRLGGNRLAPSRHSTEFLLACVVARARAAARVSLPARVELRHAAPADPAPHRRWFAAPIGFGAARDALVFTPASLEAPLQRADPALRAILDRHAAFLLDRLPRDELLGARVAAWLRDRLGAGEVALADAARHFRMSERNLQRRLAGEEDSFEAIVTRTRAGEARRLLDEGTAIGEVAFALGFSEASAFHRAFKRWTGMTPAAYRKQG